MKIHCLYRDFFVFLRMLNLERDTWKAFKQYYYDKHTDFLSYLWHEYHGYSTRNIRERVSVIKKEDYADIESLLKIYDIEEETRETLLHCKRVYHDNDQCNVYLIIGFFSPDAFVLWFRDRFVLCVGLERFHSFNRYDVLLAHEYFHYIQNKLYGPVAGPLALQLIREGICVQFSKIAFPNKKEQEYFFLPEQVFHDAEKSYEIVVKRIKSKRIRREQLFSGNSGDLPPRIGYYVGYRIILDFIKGTDFNDPSVLLGREKQILMDFMGK